MTDKMSKPKSGISRRTVVKGTAWAVPAVVVASAAPAMAASPCLTASFGGNSCKQPGLGQNADGYALRICFTNNCASTVTITVTGVESKSSGVRKDISQGDITVTPGQTQCLANLVIYCSTNSGNFLFVYYKVNGGAEQRSADIPSPPRCADTVPPLCG